MTSTNKKGTCGKSVADFRTATHDLKNIIMGAVGHLSLIRSRLSGDPKLESSLQTVERILAEACRVAETTLKPGELGQSSEGLFSVIDLLYASAAVCVADGKTLFRCVWDPDLPKFFGDPEEMSRVFFDMLSNAVQALPEGGDILAEVVRADNGSSDAMAKGGDFLSVRISDSGKGIPRRLRDRIFREGYSTRKGGSGVGLYNVKKRMEAMGGLIRLSNGRGDLGGASFELLLPAADQIDPRTVAEQAHPSTAGLRVLLLDDDSMILRIVCEMLEHFDCEAVSSRDPRQTVEFYRDAKESEKGFDVVILDLNLPGGMNGERVAREILEFDPDAYLVVSSGWQRDFRIRKYREYGVSACLNKPYSLEDLKGVLLRCLNNNSYGKKS